MAARNMSSVLSCAERTAFLDVLNVGKDIYHEFQREFFVADSVTVERLRDRCLEFVISLLVVSRPLESQENVMDDILQAVIEFQTLIERLEERLSLLDKREVHYSCPTMSSKRRGRPTLVIPEEQLDGLRSLGFSWSGIAKMLGVSEKTIRRRRDSYSMASSRELFSEISDDEVDNLVEHVLQISPNSGEKMIMGWFRGRGIRVQRWRLRQSIMWVDPVGRELRQRTVTKRRVYSVPTPDSLWHLDGHHKLIRWRIVIHGAIDGFSRTVVFLKASTNNEASTVLDLFVGATNIYHYPRRIRTDYGTENVDVARLMLTRYGVDSKPVLTGQSVHNQRIERLWRDVHNYVVSYYKNIFYFLEERELLDPNDEIDLYALHYIYIPRLNNTIDQFVMQWNNHPLSREGGHSPLQKWTEGFYQYAQSDYMTVRELLDPRSVDHHYGIDDNAPLPELQTANHIEVLRSTIQLAEREFSTLLNDVHPLSDDGEHGISLYEISKISLMRILNM